MRKLFRKVPDLSCVDRTLAPCQPGYRTQRVEAVFEAVFALIFVVVLITLLYWFIDTLTSLSEWRHGVLAGIIAGVIYCYSKEEMPRIWHFLVTSYCERNWARVDLPIETLGEPHELREFAEWCKDNIRGWVISRRFVRLQTGELKGVPMEFQAIYFSNPNDAMMFKMRWT